ncbi:hypothetical protein Q427_23250 [Halomonas sp. BC04]|nr:hypothetical protein Q427_23250 [Halomonas sp. BC04]
MLKPDPVSPIFTESDIMTQTLLFACDLSEENRAAYARAIRLAHESGARLDVIHVLDPYLPRRVLHDLEEAVVADMQAMMTDIREDYALPEPQTLLQTVAGATYARSSVKPMTGKWT